MIISNGSESECMSSYAHNLVVATSQCQNPIHGYPSQPLNLLTRAACMQLESEPYWNREGWLYCPVVPHSSMQSLRPLYPYTDSACFLVCWDAINLRIMTEQSLWFTSVPAVLDNHGIYSPVNNTKLHRTIYHNSSFPSADNSHLSSYQCHYNAFLHLSSFSFSFDCRHPCRSCTRPYVLCKRMPCYCLGRLTSHRWHQTPS